VAPALLLTRVSLRLNRVPQPESGVKSFEKAEMRSVLIGPPPGRMLPDTFQLLAVSPAPDTGVPWKVTTVSSKVKSPWNPIRLSALSMAEVTTGWVKLVAEMSMVAIGRETMAIRVGDGVGVAVGIGVGPIVAVAVAVGVTVA